jgi:hypothetical protein
LLYPLAPRPDEGGVVLGFGPLQELIDDYGRHERKRWAPVGGHVLPVLQPIYLHVPTQVAPYLRHAYRLFDGVLNVEIRYFLWLISHCFYSSKTSDLIHHLHF